MQLTKETGEPLSKKDLRDGETEIYHYGNGKSYDVTLCDSKPQGGNLCL